MARTVFDDVEFIDHVVGLLTQDMQALHTLAPLLEVEDFKPLRGIEWGQERWVVADRALAYYHRFHQPIGKLLRADIIEYAEGLQLNERQVAQLESYVTRLQKIKLNGAEAVVEKVTTFKLQRIKAATIQEMIDLQATGQLSDDKWMELCQKAVNLKTKQAGAVSYFDTFDSRQSRRSLKQRYDHNPAFLIEPLDDIIYPGLSRKQLGLIIGPTSRGKSLFLIWLAMAYALQRCNVLYFTLEDSQDDVENRLDSSITGIPFTQIENSPKLLRSRFSSYRRLISGNLHIIDGTEEAYTPAMIEQRIQEQREQGFLTDVVIIDYDKYLQPTQSIKSGNPVDVMDSIYRDIRRLAAKYNLYMWTAAQTQRNTSDLKVLTGDKVAEAFEKIRKTVIAISMGKGDLGDDSYFLWLAKNKFGRGQIGCHILPNLEHSLVYDHEKTRKALNAVQYQQEESEEYPTE